MHVCLQYGDRRDPLWRPECQRCPLQMFIEAETTWNESVKSKHARPDTCVRIVDEKQELNYCKLWIANKIL